MTLDAVLRRAISRAPCSIRALAKTAGVSHVTLALVAQGKREKQRATPRVALKVARALEQWAARCGGEAAAIRAAVGDHSHKEAV